MQTKTEIKYLASGIVAVDWNVEYRFFLIDGEWYCDVIQHLCAGPSIVS